ncbi:MAG: chemotaxis protein CheW [Elusimicrobiota bacterium]
MEKETKSSKSKIAKILQQVQEKYNMGETGHEETREILSFLIGDEIYAIDILNVYEIVVPGKIFNAPTTPPYVIGVINLKGEVLPVIDLKQFLGISETLMGIDSRIIVVGERSKLGLLVESTIDIIYVPVREIQPALATIEKIKADYFDGEILFDDKLISLLNLEKIITSKEIIKPGGS